MAIPVIVKYCFMFAVQEGVKWKERQLEKEKMYNTALYRANELSRPLIIIGDDGLHPNEVRVGCGPIPNNSFVVYCCYSLEKSDDIEDSWNEIIRIAGSPFNVFVSHLKGGMASLSPEVKWSIESAPPFTPSLEYKPRSIALIKTYGE